ncbi:MAG: permease-like cell division protein FtsX [Bacteroidales bacterium]|nr:permease-like cell division protein FtsX [Bacteroidales bacterium]
MLQQESKYNNRRLKSSFVTTVVSISLVLFMLGLLGMILLHAKKLSNYVKENISLSVILSEDVKEAKIIEFQKKLDITDYVKSTEYITKEQAAEDLSRELGEDFIEFLGYNPLSPTIDLHLKAHYANTDSIQKIEKEILANKYVKEVFYQKSLVHLVNDNLKKISYVILGFSVLLLLIAIALINNTIRLSVYARRFLIKSMQLVGATQGYIRRPFVILSIIHGLVSSLIAILLLTGILYFTQTEIPEIIKLQDYKIFLSLFVIMIFLGILFTGISTFFAVKKYLKINNDKIYY